jgi:hypothetical protein
MVIKAHQLPFTIDKAVQKDDDIEVTMSGDIMYMIFPKDRDYTNFLASHEQKAWFESL